MAPVVLPADIFPLIVRHCHPRDARSIQRLNKKIASVITTNDLVWGEARWRWGRWYWDCWEWAADKGHVDVLAWCLESDSLNEAITDGSALRSAAAKGPVGVVQLLLDKGADLHRHGRSVLGLAAGGGHADIVQLLFDKGVELRDDGVGRTGIIVCEAAKRGHLEVVRLLLEKGADMHFGGYHALQWAAGKGRLEVARLLLKKGADVHAGDDEALCLAAGNGHLEVVRLLLENGANVHAQGEEALRSAVEKGRVKVVRLLLENGVNVHACRDALRRTRVFPGYEELVSLLKAHVPLSKTYVPPQQKTKKMTTSTDQIMTLHVPPQRESKNTTTPTDQIILNVGGTSFTTTKSTLLRPPNSALAALVRFNQDIASDKSESPPVTPIHTVFLDEDPEVFKVVLTYLRHDILAMPAKGEPSLAAVEAVGEYLNLPGLVQKARDVACPTVIYKAVFSDERGGTLEFPLASPDLFERINSLNQNFRYERMSAQFSAHRLEGKPTDSVVDWCLSDFSCPGRSSTWMLMEGRKRSRGAV
ncbi:hypothetical protein HK104_003293 [Borealophlyctis nickersoniae]|nr:hypothetical protein HK104_003293 [Borealophlyctis nickersoniae]